jgi:hypothetical protein
MTVELAPRPANEERRAQAVVKTGMLDHDQGDLFQIYCDLAQDITGFDTATFSLFDADHQCHIAASGRETEGKSLRNVHNVCSYVLLSPEPLLAADLSESEQFRDFPNIRNGGAKKGYAGFPVINKDNYALGTLCMVHDTPKAMSADKVELVKKITVNMAHQLDMQTEQRELTSQKMMKAVEVFAENNPDCAFDDFKQFIRLCCEFDVDVVDSARLKASGLIEVGETGRAGLSSQGRQLQFDMGLQTKVMNKIKVTGDQANIMLEDMLAQISGL